MTERRAIEAVLNETFDYLRNLVRDCVEPSAALTGLAGLATRHPETPLDLVWLEEPFDRSVHYDALIQVPGEGTVSLSFSPDGGLPWPLRGVQRWRDRDLARVNDMVLTVDDGIAQLDFVWDEAPIVRRLLDVCLIRQALASEPIALADADLQEAMDAFRRARRLFAAEDTHRWLAEKGITPEKLEHLIHDQATLTRLRGRVADGRVEEYFAAHRAELAEVALLRLEFADQERAHAALAEARRGAALPNLARSGIAEAVACGQSVPVLQSTVLRRKDAAKLELELLSGAQPGDVLGPLPSPRGAALLQVLAIHPACLDARTRQTIVHLLFEEWLAERRQAARVEWYWGNATGIADV